jgi:hypothetical protein
MFNSFKLNFVTSWPAYSIGLIASHKSVSVFPPLLGDPLKTVTLT